MHARKYKQHKAAASNSDDPRAVGSPDGVAAMGDAVRGAAASPPPDIASGDNTTALLARVQEAENAARLAREHHAALQAQLEAQSKQQQAPDPERMERAQQFLELNPHLRDHMDVLAAAHGEALSKGIADESPDYWDHLQSVFGNIRLPAGGRVAHDAELARREQPSGEQYNQGGRVPVERERTPDIVRGAPVSREIASWSTGRSGHVEQKLNRQELEHAKLAGVSEETYLEQKLKMEEYKRLGLLQDGNR